MKVSHELPLGLMHKAYEWNDYDYCLPHLIDKYQQYKLFFQKSRKDKRFIIMDNGLFEGVEHTIDDLFEKINLVRPDVFVVPDAWNDANRTLVNAKSWMINFKPNLPEGVELMAVCQGQNMAELARVYTTLVDLGYKYIAINHSSIAYIEDYPGEMPLLKKQMYGRMEFIRRLVEKGTIRKSIHHHLLGCSLPQEFMSYGSWPFIKTVDTSNPILVGAEGHRYTDSGIHFKPANKLEHYIEMNLEDRIEDITFNVNKFKSYIK